MTQFPRIHLNGTDGGALADEYMNGIVAVGAAIKAVEAITVHGRDYYVIDRLPGHPDPSSVAMAEHRARLFKLKEVHDELMAIAENVAEQNDARRS